MSTRKLTAIFVPAALLCLNLNTAIPAQMEKRPVLAVMPLPADEVTEIEARQVTVHIIDHMKRKGDFIVLDFVHSENALQDLGRSTHARVDRETTIRAGKKMSADKVLAGNLSRKDDIYNIRLEMIDVASGLVEGQSTVRSKLGFQELPATMSALLDPLIHQDSVQADIEAPELQRKSERPVREAGGSWHEPETGMEFVWIPAGDFLMGTPTGKANERPVRQVHLDGFWMGKYEVTQGEWLKIMDSNPSFSQKGDRYPVDSVSWIDVQQYIRMLNSRTGRSFRLPTEAEWEYACRAGTPGDRYGDLDEIAWYERNTGGSTRPVGMKTSNSFGLYDMLGNVWEWCQDFYGPYNREHVRNPRGPVSGSSRVFRGGSCLNVYATDIRAANRARGSQNHKHRNLGFRLVFVGEGT